MTNSQRISVHISRYFSYCRWYASALREHVSQVQRIEKQKKDSVLRDIRQKSCFFLILQGGGITLYPTGQIGLPANFIKFYWDKPYPLVQDIFSPTLLELSSMVRSYDPLTFYGKVCQPHLEEGSDSKTSARHQNYLEDLLTYRLSSLPSNFLIQMLLLGQ